MEWEELNKQGGRIRDGEGGIKKAMLEKQESEGAKLKKNEK